MKEGLIEAEQSEAAAAAAAAAAPAGAPRGAEAGENGTSPPRTASTEAQAMDVDDPLVVSTENVTELRGHKSEVFICAWSPTEDVLASGSGDSTARIWTIPEGASGTSACAAAASSQVVLNHFSDRESGSAKSKDVTTLDWNSSGTKLATGSYDGQAWVWNKAGNLEAALHKHKGPIFSLKWSKNGQYLLSGSVDKTAIVWDVASRSVKQQFSFHDAPTLDVDWKDNSTFATCSTDKLIHVCRIGSEVPVMTFAGHKDEVNAIKWSPDASLLASCSDDYTAKVWRMDQKQCVYDLSDHTKEIYTIKWSPTTERGHMLASASFDATIKLWDAGAGVCVRTLKQHTDPVYSVAFSPDGKYLASGSFDRQLLVWSVADGKLVKKFKGGGGIFEVCWNKAGNKIASCFSNNVVNVVDFRM